MKKSKSKIAFDAFNITLMALLVVVTMYPIFNQLALSLSSSDAIMSGTVNLIPKEFTFATYQDIAKESLFWRNYANTVWYTFIGTLISLALTTLLAYSVSKKDLVGGNIVLKLVVFTMFFNGGLIPTYMLIKGIGLTDTIWALLLPTAIMPYHVLLMKTFFQNLPIDLEEASRLDGLSQFGYFVRIALPLSKPIMATMTLFIAVIYWNDWFNALIYLNDGKKYPVTLYLRNVMMGAAMASQTGEVDSSAKSVPQSIQAASMILVILPVLCIYPFVQKYFVKGVMIGAIKG